MIIVTGGAGFIGSAFVWKLNREGLDKILIIDDLGDSDKWKNLVHRNFADYIHKEKFLPLLDEHNRYLNASAVIHLGACSSTTERDADYLIENNYRYTRILAEWSLKNNIPFIYASSAATYGSGDMGFSDNELDLGKLTPMNMYAYSKHIFDLWAHREGILDKMTGIKFFNVFGPNEYHKGNMISMIYRAFNQIREKGHVKLFKSYKKEYSHGEQLRDFIYVKDCVEILWWFYNNKDITGIFNVGTGKARSWNDLVKAIFDSMSLKTEIQYIDMPEDLRDRYQYYTEAKMDKLQKAGCGYQFPNLEDSVNDYVRNYLIKEYPYL